MIQDKQKEIDFFDSFSEQEYNVFSDKANNKIIKTVEDCGQFVKGGMIADLGCGSGVFTQLMNQRGYNAVGIDLSQTLTQYARRTTQQSYFQGDVETLPFKSNSLDGVVLSALIHHLPNPELCFKEVLRVLKPGARMVGFDPNRLNPFMYLYRDKSSPLYSSKGVTENERPVLPKQLQASLSRVGFEQVGLTYVSGLSYRYIASKVMRKVLPIYNMIDKVAFTPSIVKKHRVFVFSYAQKPTS